MCVTACSGSGPDQPPFGGGGGTPGLDVFVFSETAGFRHTSISAGIGALQSLGAARGWTVTDSEDSSRFNDAFLAGFEVVVFLNTSGDVLTGAEQAAFERYIRAGGGFVGTHSAADTEYGWAWYGQLVGAYFDSHPAIQSATINVEDSTHPSTQHLGATWTLSDEWYNYRANPRNDVEVLMSLDETTYLGGTMGDHPIAWYHFFEGGRAFYTGLGHPDSTFNDTDFQAHLAGAIEWAAGDTTPLLVNEFDGTTTPGAWTRMDPRVTEFPYVVNEQHLMMLRDSSANQHLVRDGVLIDASRPYFIEVDFTIDSPTPPAVTSFAINFHQDGPDGDYSDVSCWALNLNIAPTTSPGGTILSMGFVTGIFAQIASRNVAWGEPDIEYSYRVEVNRGLDGRFRDKMVTAAFRQGAQFLVAFEQDFSTYPFQPVAGQPVRFGLNSHGANWTVRNLRVGYLD